MELGASTADLPASSMDAPGMDAWEDAARRREEDEVRRYEALLEVEMDTETRRLVEEILDTERHHAAELGGKWTTA